MRHTKILATLGPATDTDAAVSELIAAGVDVFRLNFSHGSHESHAVRYRRIRVAAKRAGRVVAIMQDLSGPKIRIGRLAGGQRLDLPRNSELRIATGDFPGEPGRVSTTYAELARSVRAGDRLLLDDGRIELRVVESDGTEISTRVVHGGLLAEHKGINAPGVTLPTSAITVKDAQDLSFGLELGVDMIAVSFVQTAEDLRRVRRLASGIRSPAVPIIAKIERRPALANIGDILTACDAVMVARGDLGLELPLEQVPRLQKEITQRARAHGLPVIVATQVLDSMRSEPRPTRAEVSDAAKAVDDGVDAIMLAGETAVGAFPVRAVQVLDAVIRDAEAMPAQPSVTLEIEVGNHGRALCQAAVTLAAGGQANAIVAVTRAGRTSQMLSALRPRVPIYAATDSEELARVLTLYWGVTPVVVRATAKGHLSGERVDQRLLSSGTLADGALAVFVRIHSDLAQREANFVTLRRVGAELNVSDRARLKRVPPRSPAPDRP